MCRSVSAVCPVVDLGGGGGGVRGKQPFEVT